MVLKTGQKDWKLCGVQFTSTETIFFNQENDIVKNLICVLEIFICKKKGGYTDIYCIV